MKDEHIHPTAHPNFYLARKLQITRLISSFIIHPSYFQKAFLLIFELQIVDGAIQAWLGQ